MYSSNSKIVVLGGGTAGWLTALWIKKYWPANDISVIEDPNRPPIIAGESGTTTFIDILRHLDIDINDFILKVNATPKLGGRFTDWRGEGTEFIHCLQTDYAPWLDGWTDYYEQGGEFGELRLGEVKGILSAENAKDTYLKTIIGNDIPLSKAFYANYFIEENKTPFGAKSELPVRPMWHFESRSSAAYFKDIGLQRGIKLILGVYQDAVIKENGDVSELILENNQHVSADWFFDCSGFARLLLHKKLKEPIIDYTKYFPSRAVVAWWGEPCACVTTNAIAMKYGWSWNINLRHRSGNGYIYDPDHITVDQAISEAESRFNTKIEPIAQLEFTPGMARNTWKNNVIAIGLSNGFMEPLEANGVAVIIESLYALHDHWNPTRQIYPESRQRFNDRTWAVAEDIKDFLALHYRGGREDSEFWRSHKYDDRIPDTLKAKLEAWRVFYENQGPEPYFNGYSATAWLMVLQGLRVFDHSKIAAQYENLLDKGQRVSSINIARYKKLVEPFWTADEWIQRISV